MQHSAKVFNLNNKITIEKQVSPVTLSAYVTEKMKHYFSQLNGHETSGLHAMVISEVEKPLIEATLKYCDQNQSKASKLLGLSRSTLRKKIQIYDLS